MIRTLPPCTPVPGSASLPARAGAQPSHVPSQRRVLGRSKACVTCARGHEGRLQASPGRDSEWGRSARTRCLPVTRPRPARGRGARTCSPAASHVFGNEKPGPITFSWLSLHDATQPLASKRGPPSPQEPRSLPGCPRGEGEERGGTCVCLSKTLCAPCGGSRTGVHSRFTRNSPKMDTAVERPDRPC